MLDGASLEWGSTSLTCDGEFSCSFSLPSGAPHTVRTEGEVSIEVGCGGVSRLGLACAHRTCVPDSLTIADSGADHRGYFPYWAPEASGAARDFRAAVRGAPEELLRHPEPVIAEIGMLDGRLRDTLRGCSELQCRLEDRDVGWLAAADMAGRLSSQVIAVTGVDRTRWGTYGWTAHYASLPASAQGGPQIVGDLDCYDFSDGDALPAAACALTVRSDAFRRRHRRHEIEPAARDAHP